MKRATKRLKPLRIWRVFGDQTHCYAVLVGDWTPRQHEYPELGTVTARTEAEAITRVYEFGGRPAWAQERL